MRRRILLMLALLLLVPTAFADNPPALVIECPERHFSVTLNADYSHKWIDGDGLYIFARQEDYFPYILVQADYSDDRVTDGPAFLSDTFYSIIKDEFGQYGGTSYMGYGSYTLAGRDVAAADYEFTDSSGIKHFYLFIIDARQDCSLYYKVRYVKESDRQTMLDLLDEVAAGIRLDAEQPVSYTCEPLGFTTLVEPSWRMEWAEGDGQYFHFGDDFMPYVFVWVDRGDAMITDGRAYLDDVVSQMQEDYKKNGAVAVTQYGSFQVGGRDVAAVDMQYRNKSGVKIYLLLAIDVRERCSVIYSVRYLDQSQRQKMLDGLELIASNMRFDEDQAAADPDAQIGSPAPASGAQADPARPGDPAPYSLAVTDLTENDNALGRCVAPKDAKVVWSLFSCTNTESYSHPCRVMATARTDDGIVMNYFSDMDYVSELDGTTTTGTFNSGVYTPALQYMNASEYCDYLASKYDQTIERMTMVSQYDFPELADVKDAAAQKELSKGVGQETLGLMSADKAEATVCRKRYTYEADGASRSLTVMTGVVGVQYTMHGYVDYPYIAWEVPFIFTMECPAEIQDRADVIFDCFVNNTRVSDQFVAANKKISEGLWAHVSATLGLAPAKSYSAQVLRDETASGDDYNEECITDYIFDDNDYTLSDGSHVKVSTQYDYVYEGDNGVVYYSDSAFAPTNGGTQLYPN